MKRSPRHCRPTIERLEVRTLLSANNTLDCVMPLHTASCCCGCCGAGGTETDPLIQEAQGHRETGQLRVDSLGNRFYHDPIPDIDPSEIIAKTTTTTSTSSDGAVAASGTLSVPILHSNPGATKKIYLDFNGHVVSDTLWNKYNNNRDIHASAYDTDGNIFGFSSSEITNIREIWKRVAEDFAPFNVDVTTEDPGLSALTAGGRAIRVLISGSRDEAALGGTGKEWYPNAGGVTYLNSWEWTSDTPAWVFADNLGNGSEKYVAEATSHETGHALGLSHDGTSSSSYYSGHGSGSTGWASIMGVSYYQPVTQWGKGEYSGANNTEDDLGQIASYLGFRTDDHGNSLSTATRLAVGSDGSFSDSGIISTRSDLDVFAFSTGSGGISLSVSPFEIQDGKGNLDIAAKIFDSSGREIASSNPTDSLGATFNINLAAGTYYLQVDGTGKGDPRTNGYSDYGSLGQYTISGNAVASGSNSDPAAANDTATTLKDQSILIDVLDNDHDVDGDNLTIASVSSAANGRTALESGRIRYTPNSGFRGTDSFIYSVSDGKGGRDSATVTVTVTDLAGALSFSGSKIISYAGDQDYDGTATISGNNTISLKGNTWKAITLPYNITSNTMIEFDFSSSSQGEIHGIGLDNDLSYNTSRTFQLYGTQDWGVSDYQTYNPRLQSVKHYVIPVGEFYTGSMKYLFFANDHDVSDPTAQSTFSNFKIYEGGENAAPIAKNDNATTKTGFSTTINVLANDTDADGDTLSVSSVTQPANGTVSINSNDTLKYTPKSGFRGTDSFTYTISDGKGGRDSGTVTVTVTDTAGTLDLSSRTILRYAGEQDYDGTATVSGTNTLNLSGNTWKAIALPYNLTSKTVLEFDFSSSAQGEIHGIGLDNDLSYNPSRTFQLYGSQSWGLSNYDNYNPKTLSVKHYVIPVGQFYTGSMKYLFFANDHDIVSPYAQSTFSNIKIYDAA